MWMLLVAATLDAATLAGVARDAMINAVFVVVDTSSQPLPAHDDSIQRDPLVGPRRVPCFAAKPKLDARDMHDDLDSFREGRPQMTERPPPSGSYGTCRVRDGVVRERDGTPVAQLHCGMDVLVRGIRDPLGHEIGARGADILVDHSGLEPVCVYAGPVRTRCWFPSSDSDEPAIHYTMRGVVPGDEVKGAAVREFFASSTLVGFTLRGSCH